jgi:proline iminopeptidase
VILLVDLHRVVVVGLLAVACASPRPNRERISEGYLSGADGIRLFYRRVGSTEPLTIYVHGGPGSNFRGNGEYLDPLGATQSIVMYDQRGSGRSEVVSDPKLLTVDHHIRDLDAVRTHFSASKINLVGLSWGAGLAAMYAARYPTNVRGLLLVSPIAIDRSYMAARQNRIGAVIADSSARRVAEIRAKMVTARDNELAGLCREVIDINFRPYLATATPEKLQVAARRCDIPAAAIRNRAVVEAATLASLGDWDFRATARQLQMPVLVIEGSETNVPLDATRQWAIEAPNARFLLIPDAGHELFLDQPQLFQRAAREFLTGSFPRGSEDLKGRKSRRNSLSSGK